MAASVLDFYQGDSVYLDLKLTDGSTADDLTDATIYVTMKSSMDDPDSAAVLNVAQTIPSSPSAEQGLATIVLGSDATDIAAGTYFVGIRRVRDGSPKDVWTIQAGKARVRASVLRDIP